MIDEKYKENGMEGGFMNGVERIAKERKRQIGEDYEEIRKLKKKGHSEHCACRQVWGDGECECHLHEQVYDPYAWMRPHHRLNKFPPLEICSKK